MNPLLLIGGAVVAVGLLGLILSMLLRPKGSKAHLTVADLQARLADEQSATPGPEGSQDDETAADQPHTADTVDPARREREHPPMDTGTRDEAAPTGRDGTEARAEHVLLPDHRRRAQ